MTEKSRQNHLARGILLMLGASFGFAAMSSTVKLAGDLPVLQKVFFRNFISLLAAVAVLIKNHQPLSVRPGNRLLMFLRCFLGTMGIVCNYYAIDHMLLANAAVLFKLSPFITALASWAALGEVLRLPQIMAILAAFGGSVLVAKPSLEPTTLLPLLSVLMAAFGAGTAYTCVRMLLRRGENGNCIVFCFSLFSCLFCLPFVLTGYVPMSVRQTLCLLGAGVFASVGQFCMTNAYRYAASREISAVEYSQIVFAAVLGFVLFGQIPDSLSLLGYVVIFGAVLFNSWYNGRKNDR